MQSLARCGVSFLPRTGCDLRIRPEESAVRQGGLKLKPSKQSAASREIVAGSAPKATKPAQAGGDIAQTAYDAAGGHRAVAVQRLSFTRSRALQKRFHQLIPAGSHTYAKGDDQYPAESPVYITHGQGCHVWDADGNEFIEYGMGLRAVALGHAYAPVVEAAYRQMQLGTNFTRPGVLELSAAEKALELIDTADMVKFAKNGSDTTTAAVKLARAYTGRNLVAVCADQGFFSTDDWFVSHTAMKAGIPKAISDLTVSFHYNDLESVRDMFATHPGEIACLVLEAETSVSPADGFLPGLRRLCDENGALLVFDEMITGFRWHARGAQKLYGVTPDLSTFGKAMSNGFALSALFGKREIMELGGLHHDKERVFLLSTTHGAEQTSLAAGIEVMRIYQEENVIEHLYHQGERLAAGVESLVDELGLDGHFGVLGRPSNLVYFTRDQDKKPSQPFRTLFIQEILNRGILAPSFVVSYSHTDADIDATIERVGEALVVYKRALEDGVEKYLRGRPVKPVLRTYN